MKESLRLSPPLTRKWVICYCAFLWCLSQLPVGTSLFFLTCCRHGSFVVDGITHLQSLFICCPAVVSSEYSEYLLNILQINSKIFKVACPNKDCRLLNCDEGRVIIVIQQQHESMLKASCLVSVVQAGDGGVIVWGICPCHTNVFLNTTTYIEYCC